MTTHDEPLPLPNRRAVWRWVASSSRPYVGWLLAVLGAVSLFLGWWGVSGQSLTSKQLPYLVSGGLTGIGLVILAAVFLTTDDVRRQMSRIDEMERKVDDLYALLVVEARNAALEPDPATTVGAAPTRTAKLVALPTGSSYHLPSCALVAGKTTVSAVDARSIRARSLRPCRVCEPPAGKSR
jgi:hypothetical protein